MVVAAKVVAMEWLSCLYATAVIANLLNPQMVSYLIQSSGIDWGMVS